MKLLKLEIARKRHVKSLKDKTEDDMSNMIVLAEIENEELESLIQNHRYIFKPLDLIADANLYLYTEQTGVSFDNHSLYVFSNNNLHPSRRTKE